MLLYLLCFLAAAGLLALDQWAKFWVENHMVLEEIRPLFPPMLELHAVHNYGAAWSLLAGSRWILVAVTGVMMLAVALALCLRLVRHPVGVLSAFLILSGGVGNLLDRIFQGYVVDMLRFPFWTSYPTFNVADICVVSGCVLWLLYVLFVKEDLYGVKPEAEKAKTVETAKDADGRSDQIPEEKPDTGGWEFGPGTDTDTDSETGTDSSGDTPESGQRTGERVWNAAPQRGDSGQTETPSEERKREIPLPPVPPVLLSETGRAAQAAASGQKEPPPDSVMRLFLNQPETPPSDADKASSREADPAVLGGSPWKALLEEEDQAAEKSEKSGGDRSGDWDSAENFFGGTPFRMSDKNGRVWP